METQNKQKKNNTVSYRFRHNRKYLTISIYALAVIIIGAFAVNTIFHIGDISDAFMKFMSTISSFIGAFFIAYFLNPLVKTIDSKILVSLLKMKNEKTRRFVAILSAYIVFVGILVVLLIVVIPQFFTQFFSSITSLTSEKNLTYIYTKIGNFFTAVGNRFPYIDWNSIQDEIFNYIPQLIKASTDAVTEFFPKLINISISIVKAAINIILAIVVSCYMLSEKKILKKNTKKIIYSVFRKERATSICQTFHECNQIFYSFVIGKAIDSLIIGILCFIIISIIDIPYSLLISVVVGVTNMIPYFGPFIGAIPCIVVLLFTEPLSAIIFTIVIFILQQFDGLYLGPKILGQSVGLTPLWVVFGITIGGAYGGVFGMFLGVPLTAVFAYLLSKFLTNILNKRGVSDSDLEE